MFIVPDGCHVLKLVRNALHKQDFFDADGNIISWAHLVSLVEYQEKNDLHAANKIRTSHLHPDQNPMNVRMAAQTLSESASVSLRHIRDDIREDDPVLEEQRIAQFQNIEGTAKFCSMFNEAFDILNSRQLYNKNKSKDPITPENVGEVKKKLKKSQLTLRV